MRKEDRRRQTIDRGKITILIVALILLLGGIPAGAEEDWADMPTADGRPQAAEEQPSDPRQMKIEALRWKGRYLDCLVTNLELAYRVKAYQDPQYIEVRRQLDELNRELRALVMGAPTIKKGPPTADGGPPKDKK